MEDLLKTCLYDRHEALHAQMSPFGGFIMPIQYSSIQEEHQAVRRKAGVFDVSHMGEIFVSGPDAEKFINHIFTNDIRIMPTGKIQYGMMLYPDGGVVDDLLVYKMTQPAHYLLVVNAANIAKDEAWMRSQSPGYDVCIENRSEEWGEIALQGPEAEHIAIHTLGFDMAERLAFYTFAETSWNGSPVLLSRTGYTGEDGFEFYAAPEVVVALWDRLIESGVTPCGLGCRDTLRFEVGLPLYGHELSAEISPVEAGLGLFVKTGKEDFIGRDAMVKQKTEGTQRKLVGIELTEKAIPRAGYPVECAGEVIGQVTTGYQSLSTGKYVCMALIDRKFAEIGTAVSIRIRKKTFAGMVCKKRFYDKNYKK